MAFSTHDIVPDSPTNNFCTVNPLQSSSTSNITTQGNLRVSITSTASIRGNFYVPEGKWYYEVYVNTLNNLYLGLASNGGNPTNYVADEAFGVNNTGGILWNTAATGTAGTGLSSIPLAANSIYGIFFDADAKLFWISKNGQWYSCNSSSFSSISKTDVENGLYGFDFSALSGDSYTSNFGNSTTSGAVISVNFGQDPTFGGTESPTTTYPDKSDTEIGRFFYDPPAGALALCTANLPDFTPDVDDDTPQDYFKAVKYVGNGTSQGITGVGFQPDLVWVKNRTSALNHVLSDAVRGANNALFPSTTGAEFNSALNLTSFDSDGFSVGSGNTVNGSGNSLVAWCWKAGGAPTADNSNTSGAMTANSVSLNGTLQSNYTPAGSPTIYPTRMSINTNAGFSIVKYTGNGSNGATVPHGLNQTPDISIFKNLDSSIDSWFVGGYPNLSAFSASNRVINLNNNYGMQSGSSNAATNGSNLITIDIAGSNLGSTGVDYIVYCWHSVEGYSKFGSYTGNGSADGPLVYCGFRPSFIMTKRTNTSDNWFILDNKRNESNPVNSYLMANSSSQEDPNNSTVDCDFLSNGFKIRATTTGLNATGSTYIYMAFAEQPFKYSNAR